MRRPFLPSLLLLMAGLALAGSPALGAGLLPTGSSAPQDKAPATPAVQPVPPSEIVVRGDLDERFLQDAISRARQPDPSAKLVPALETLANGVKQLSDTFKRDELRQLPAMRLESLARHWRFYEEQLADWRSQLQAITGRYSDDAAELARRRAVWEATRSAAQANGLAPALAERVDSILAQIGEAERALSGPLDAQLKLAQRGNTVQQAIDSGERAVDAAIKYFDRRLGMIDAPPIWEAWHDRSISEQGTSALMVGLQIESEFLKEYNARNAVRLHILHGCALLLLPVIVMLSRRSRKLVTEDPDLASSAQVLLRPISAWLVLVLVGVLFFEPDAPLIRHQAALLLALVPVLRLLPKRVFDLLGPWPYIVTGLYLVDQLGFLFAGVPLLHRLHLLGIGAVTALVLLWLLIRSRPRDGAPAPRRLSSVIRVAGWIALVLLLTAVVSNCIGNVSLAEVLTGGVLDSAYVGLALYAGAMVLTAILKLVLARRGATRFRVVTQHTGPLLKSVGKGIGLAAFAFWVLVVLNEFRVYRPVAKWVKAVLTYPIEAGEISITLGSVLLFLASVWVAFVIARTIRFVLRDEVLPDMSLPRGVANSISTLTYYGVVTAGVMVALAAAGFHLSQLALVVGALGVGIGLGLQDVVRNFVSGLILMFERPIQPGDVVEVGGVSGKVREIGMRATTLGTFEGADVVLPNGMLLSEKLINWTLSDMDRRFEVNVGVAYGTDPRRVLDLLMETTRATPGITANPEPIVLFVGFGASSLDFSIRAWTHDFGDWVKIRSELALRVHDAIRAAGIEIPFPQQDLHLRSVSPELRAQLAGREPRTDG